LDFPRDFACGCVEFSTGLYVRYRATYTGLYVRHLIYPVKNHLVNESSNRVLKIVDFVDNLLEKRTARRC